MPENPNAPAPEPVSPVAQVAPVVPPVATAPAKPEPTKSPEPVKPFVFDTSKFEAKVNEFNNKAEEVAGKPNYNPYVYLTKNGVTEAVKQYKLGNRSQEIYDLVMRVPSTIPVIDPNWVAPEPYKPALPKALQPLVRK